MGFAQANAQRLRFQLFPRHPVPSQNLFVINAIDRTERVDAKDAGQCSFVLDVGQTAEGDGEFVVTANGRDLAACLLEPATEKARPFTGLVYEEPQEDKNVLRNAEATDFARISGT